MTDQSKEEVEYLLTNPLNLNIIPTADRTRGAGAALLQRVGRRVIKHAYEGIILNSTYSAYPWYLHLGFLESDTGELVLDREGIAELMKK